MSGEVLTPRRRPSRPPASTRLVPLVKSHHDVQRLAYLRRIQGKITEAEYLVLVAPRGR